MRPWDLERSLRRRRLLDIAGKLAIGGLIVVGGWLFLVVLYLLA